jgi:fructokinase
LFYNSGYKVKLLIPVGSGTLSGGIIISIVYGNGPQKAIDFACALGAIVLPQNEGANRKYRGHHSIYESKLKFKT